MKPKKHPLNISRDLSQCNETIDDQGEIRCWMSPFPPLIFKDFRFTTSYTISLHFRIMRKTVIWIEHAGSFEAKSGISEVSLVISDYGGTAAKRVVGAKKLTHLSADLILSLVKLFLCFSKSTERGWGHVKVQNFYWESRKKEAWIFLLKRHWRAKNMEAIKLGNFR